MKRNLLSFFTFVIVCFSNSGQTEAKAAKDEEKPNIIFIMVDDLGKEWISCYARDRYKIDILTGGLYCCYFLLK